MKYDFPARVPVSSDFETKKTFMEFFTVDELTVGLRGNEHEVGLM